MNHCVDITVGARDSRLSQVQLSEVLAEIQKFYPQISFSPIFMKTVGDKDLCTSLRSLDKTNFFTKEIDELQLSKGCRISIHSAKDLPEPIPKGLVIAALTHGVNPSDSLVLREGESLDSLKPGALIATSSARREEQVKLLRSDLTFVDIRGTIEMRLSKLDKNEVDGLVVAEAALIRLNLTHRNRVTLPGSTTPLQGQLAILAREDDQEMRKLFASIDSRG